MNEIPQDLLDQLTVRVNHDLEPTGQGMWIASVSVFKVIRQLLAELDLKDGEIERLRKDASWAATHRSELADLRDAFAKAEAQLAQAQLEIAKVTAEAIEWRDKLSAAQETIKRLTMPVTECLLPEFLEVMNDIGRYGLAKYGADSFQARRSNGDTSRMLKRCSSQAIADHATEHFSMYLSHIPHDHFGTDAHQLAAVAFNAMMEFYFARLASRREGQ